MSGSPRRSRSNRRGGWRGAARRAVRAQRVGAGGAAFGGAASGLDGAVIGSAVLLTGFGIVMVYSAAAPLAFGNPVPPHFQRHLLAVGLGLACIAVAVRIPLAAWRRLALPLWAAGVALLVATSAAGVEVNSARRWLAVPGLELRFQPGEVAKWATLLAVAAVLARPERRAGAGARPVVLAGALSAPPIALLVAQPDLGSTAVLIALVGLLLFVAGVRLRWLAASGGVAAAGLGLSMLVRPYALARWKGFLAPWENARTEGFQLVQSFVAFGRGGMLGVGVGDGRQKLFYLPEAHTDFILSVVAEELGLVGVLVVLAAFAGFAVAGVRIAQRARDPFALLVAFAMTAFVVVPAAVNAAVVMGLLPTTGLTLPFLSYGRTSLLMCALSVGVLLRIASREAQLPRSRVAATVPRGLWRG